MAYSIVFTGKGGTGKTTLAGITVRYLKERTGKTVLAVDADSNSCLNEALGVKVHATIGGLREESLAAIRSSGPRPGGMTTEQLFDYQVQQSIIESPGFDLIVMGRPEGPGCYCAANNIIRKYTDKLSESYPYVVIDNEAGMEHLSRRNSTNVNLMFIVSDATAKGIKTARRINDLARELDLKVDRCVLIINRAEGEAAEALKAAAEAEGLVVDGIIPNDQAIFTIDLNGRPVFDIPSDAPSLKVMYGILDGQGVA
jgi:CO dehydrogenase maturation factor